MHTPRFWRDEHERERWERDELERQRDEDRGDFYRYFRPKDDLRTITGQRGLQTIHEYLADILDFVHWNLPTTNDDVRRVLCDVVRSGRLVPYMDREWTQRPRVFRLTPAPQFWHSANASGSGNANRPLTWDEWVAFKAAQEAKATGAGAALSAPFEASPQVAQVAPGAARAVGSAARSSAGSGGAGVFGGVETVAGALFGSGGAESNDNTDRVGLLDDSGGADSGNGTTPLGDAQSFEYSEESAGRDVIDLAARGVSEEDEAECFSQYERDLDLCEALGGAMGGDRGKALCKQSAFQNYQQCRGY